MAAKPSFSGFARIRQSAFLEPLRNAFGQSNLRALVRFALTFVSLVVVYAVLFQLLMAYEGQQHSWVTGGYWTLTTMSTLGYGDVAFTSDVGRAFSMLVLLSGIIFMLVLLPFTFIQFFYEPWMEARAANRIQRAVAPDMHGHVILTLYGPVASALISKLVQFNYPYVVVLPEQEEVLALEEAGVHAICGELNDPETYVRARVEEAALVATTRDDITNTSVVFTVRGITETTPVIATARQQTSIDVLKLAGCDRVLNLTLLMAEALARRAIGGRQFVHVVGRIDDLVIAEVDAARTSLVGMSSSEAQRITSVSIVGMWARGNFEVVQPETLIEETAVLVMAGSSAQVSEFDANFQSQSSPAESHPVVIVGGGRVGRATAAALRRRGIDYRIVELHEDRVLNEDKYVFGSATDKTILHQAGIDIAPTVIITPRDDETNIYLTIFCRLLRPDIQIITRATLDRNVAALHRAGANMVMSYASMGSGALFNLLQRSDLLMIAEGLDVFKLPVPVGLAGKTLGESNIREKTGCSLIGIDTDDRTITNPSDEAVLPEDGEIVLIGTPQGETEFLKTFVN